MPTRSTDTWFERAIVWINEDEDYVSNEDSDYILVEGPLMTTYTERTKP